MSLYVAIPAILIIGVLNVLLYRKNFGKPETVKGLMLVYFAGFIGFIPFVQLSFFFAYLVVMLLNAIDNNDPNKWYNKKLK